MDCDKRHPSKAKTRPLASGAVSLGKAVKLLGLLYSILLFMLIVAPKVVMVILAYIVLNVAYTLVLKHQAIVDIFVIALGFVLRVYAGAIALSVPLSHWMFVTTFSLALYLAAIKRRQELAVHGDDSRSVLNKYSIPLMRQYAQISAICTLMFYSLFVMSVKPELVVTIPIVLFGFFRYMYITEEPGQGESPTDVLFDDWPLFCTILIWIISCLIALWPG